MTGDALICDIPAMKLAMSRSPTLSSVLIRHEQTVYAQAQQSTACMAAHQVEQRLCRWLLRARDLCGLNELSFTQEFLAEMLGVRRTSVSAAAAVLQETKIITYARGKIRITDLPRLRKSSCECYEVVKRADLVRVVPPPIQLVDWEQVDGGSGAKPERNGHVGKNGDGPALFG